MLTIREEPDVQSAVDDACERWERAAEAWDTVTWVLARDPAAGVPLCEGGKSRALTVEGARAIKMPTIIVLYEVQRGLIIIHKARFEEAQALQAGTA
jgi:hypothetical protein